MSSTHRPWPESASVSACWGRTGSAFVTMTAFTNVTSGLILVAGHVVYVGQDFVDPEQDGNCHGLEFDANSGMQPTPQSGAADTER
jgi:hypothetical protein